MTRVMGKCLLVPFSVGSNQQLLEIATRAMVLRGEGHSAADSSVTTTSSLTCERSTTISTGFDETAGDIDDDGRIL
jgi:hypothetical protein